jgi:hypothetical protein
MKTLLNAIIVATALSSLTANAAISVTNTNTVDFTFGGTIGEMCKVNSTNSGGSTALVLEETNANSTQSIGTLEVWLSYEP